MSVKSQPIREVPARSLAPVNTAEDRSVIHRDVTLVPARGDSRPVWRKLLVEGLYGSGALHFSEKVARSYEVPYASGLAWPGLRRASMPRFGVLCYHRIGTGGIPFYSELLTEAFEKQMRYLRERYRVVSLEEMVQEMSDPGCLEPAVAITFDDGYRDLFTQAFPILQAYRVPATIFLTVGSIESGDVAWYDRIFLALKVAPGDTLELVLDRPRRFALTSTAARMRAAVEIIAYLRTLTSDERKRYGAALEQQVPLPAKELADRMLNWEQVRTMHRAGISFGSHTMSHPVVSQLTPAEMEWELLESKEILEKRLDSQVRDFAFPFGKLAEGGDVATEVLVRGGYRSAATTELGLNTPETSPFQLRRVSIGEDPSLAMFAFQLNRLFLRTTPGRTDAEPGLPSVANHAPGNTQPVVR